MRIAIIGNFDQGSYASTLANEVNKAHTAYIFNSRSLGYDQTIRHNISDILGKQKDIIERIIVVQSHIFIHNDTEIPLLLYKRELGDETVDNPTTVLRKYLLYNDDTKYNTIFAAINPNRYNSERNKDIIISDIPSWHYYNFLQYIDILERSQYHLVKAFSISVRTLEALACKTIPIIFYTMDQTRQAYEHMGITDDIVHFVQFANWQELFTITSYDKDMAQRGYEFCMNNLTIEKRTQQFLEVIENYS